MGLLSTDIGNGLIVGRVGSYGTTAGLAEGRSVRMRMVVRAAIVRGELMYLCFIARLLSSYLWIQNASLRARKGAALAGVSSVAVFASLA
jgi:hypothetical protein